MDLLRLLFGGDDHTDYASAAYYEPFTINFPDKQTSLAVRTPADGDTQRIADALDIGEVNAAIFVAGGAGGMTPNQMASTRPLIEDGLARFAEENDVAIIDGGTDSGVMKMIGDVRHARGYRFPLIGVAPIGTVSFPGYNASCEIRLNAGHSHFVLTDGDKFGQESNMIARLPRALTGGSVFGLVINGGAIVREETYDRAMSPEMSAPLIVIAGSGRFSDDLARSYRGEPTEDAHIQGILQNAVVRIVPLEGGPAPLYDEMRKLLR